MVAQRRALGLDRPVVEQYATWLGRFAQGDWGRSLATGRPVRGMLGDAWPATVRLVGLSLILSYLLGIGIGAVQAMRGGTLDTALSIVSVTLFALPGYWLGLMLVMVFTYRARALPAFGSAGLDADFLTGWERVADRLRHLALPLTTLTLIGAGGTARYVRGAMLDVVGSPFVAIARAKGIYADQSRAAARSPERARSRCSPCWGCRCRRSSRARCSSRPSSPGPVSDACWSRRCRRATTRW